MLPATSVLISEQYPRHKYQRPCRRCIGGIWEPGFKKDLRAAKFYLTKNVWVKALVKSQVTLLCILLKSESWNDSRKFQVTWKPSLKPT